MQSAIEFAQSIKTQARQREKSQTQLHQITLLHLPDEILSQCVDLLYQVGPYWRSDRLNLLDIHALIFSCKRLYTLTIPYRYREIDLDYDASDYLLFRTLKASPQLGLHCRKLSFNMQRPPQILVDEISNRWEDFDLRIPEEFPSLLPNVEELEIPGGFSWNPSHPAWVVLSCAKHMCNVHSISINRVGPQILFMASKFFPRAEKLVLWPKDDESFPSDFQDLPPCSFKSLTLKGFRGSSRKLSQVLDWPVQLTEASIWPYYELLETIEPATFREMLLRHRQTLQTLKIGEFSFQSPVAILNVSDFTVLRHLHLTRWVFSEPLQYNNAEHSLLLAPNLEKFTWDFFISDQQHTQPQTGAFQEPEEKWLRAFASEAIKKQVPLRHIRIKFMPGYYWTSEDEVYPWDWLCSLAMDLASQGIAVTYDEPTMDRDEWSTIHAQHKAWEATW